MAKLIVNSVVNQLQSVHREFYFVKFIARLNITFHENMQLLFSLTFYKLQIGDRKPVLLKNHDTTNDS